MKTTDTHAFVNQILVCVLVTISFGGSIGLGTVWLRHQISLVANDNRRLAAQILETERRLADMTSEVQIQESNEQLGQYNTRFHLGLMPVDDKQVVYVAESGEELQRRLAARANRELFGNPPPAAFRVALGQ